MGGRAPGALSDPARGAAGPHAGTAARAIRSRLPLVVAALAAAALVEVVLLAADAPVAAVGAEVAAVLTLLVVGRAPLAGAALAVVAVFCVRWAELAPPASAVMPLVVPIALFVAAALTPGRRLPWLVAIAAGHVARYTLFDPWDASQLVFVAGTVVPLLAIGAVLRGREDRAAELAAEHDAVLAVLDRGPAAAVVQDQLRIWSAVRPRLQGVVATLPGRVRRAAAAFAAGRTDEAAGVVGEVRATASSALDELHAALQRVDPSTRSVEPADTTVGAALTSLFGLRCAAADDVTDPSVTTTLERIADALPAAPRTAEAHVVGGAPSTADAGPAGAPGVLRLRLGLGAPPPDEVLRLLRARVRLLGGRLDDTRDAIVLTLPLGAAAPGAEETRRPGRPSPAVLGAGALLAAGVVEQLTLPVAPPAGVAWAAVAAGPVLPLLALRSPIAGGAAAGVVLAAAAAAQGFASIGIVLNLAVILTVVAAAASAPPRRGLVALALVLGGLVTAMAVDEIPWPATGFFANGAFLAGHYVAGLLVRGAVLAQDRAGVSLSVVTARLGAVEEQAVAQERARLARELHDVVGHALTLVAVLAGGASAQLRAGRAEARDALAAMESAVALAAGELDRLRSLLSDVPAEPAGLAARLTLLAEQARAAGQPVVLDVGDVDGVPRVTADVAVRVAQEALTNAAKHASGAAVTLTLRRDGRALTLTIRNPRGTRSDLPSAGRGTASMAERVAAAGGTVVAGPTGDGGWAVETALPLA